MHNLPSRRKRSPVTDRQPPRTCSYAPAAASLSQTIYRRQKYRLLMLGRWKTETNSTQGTEFLPHAMCTGLRKMTWLAAVDCQSPRRNRKQKAQWNKEEYQKSEGRKQVVVETQWPQWITTFPTVIETICSLHTQALTNSTLYAYQNIKTDHFTHLTHASLLQHQLPTTAPPQGLMQSSVGVTGRAEPQELTVASSGSLSYHPTTFPWTSAKSSPTVPIPLLYR